MCALLPSFAPSLESVVLFSDNWFCLPGMDGGRSRKRRRRRRRLQVVYSSPERHLAFRLLQQRCGDNTVPAAAAEFHPTCYTHRKENAPRGWLAGQIDIQNAPFPARLGPGSCRKWDWKKFTILIFPAGGETLSCFPSLTPTIGRKGLPRIDSLRPHRRRRALPPEPFGGKRHKVADFLFSLSCKKSDSNLLSSWRGWTTAAATEAGTAI